jgi:hypothetical protein
MTTSWIFVAVNCIERGDLHNRSTQPRQNATQLVVSAGCAPPPTSVLPCMTVALPTQPTMLKRGVVSYINFFVAMVWPANWMVDTHIAVTEGLSSWCQGRCSTVVYGWGDRQLGSALLGYQKRRMTKFKRAQMLAASTPWLGVHLFYYLTHWETTLLPGPSSACHARDSSTTQQRATMIKCVTVR